MVDDTALLTILATKELLAAGWDGERPVTAIEKFKAVARAVDAPEIDDPKKHEAAALLMDLLYPKPKVYADGRPPIGTTIFVEGDEWEVTDYWPCLTGDDGVTITRLDDEDFTYWTMDMLKKTIAARA